MQSSRIPVYSILPHDRGRYLPLALGMIQSFARVFKDGKLERELFLAPRWRILKAGLGAEYRSWNLAVL